MATATYSLAIRRALGVRTFLGGAQLLLGHCPSCPPTRGDAYADNHHAITCERTGLQNSAHHTLARGVKEMLRFAGVGPIKREDGTCYTGPHAQGRNLTWLWQAGREARGTRPSAARCCSST